ncbi:hypothetical protein OKW96_16140 [Sphingobacterium sp. KU25419]|nr:hypothetical protein OKW96_16140 [Sphingobacterium sp. KU25419]
MAFKNKATLELKSRNDKSFNEKFYPIHNAINALDLNAIFDGEIVVVNENGTANFSALQNWRSEADGNLLYYIFDILWYNGYDLTKLELTKRRAILKALIPTQNQILISDDFETSGTEFLAAAKRLGLEGIMAKKKIAHILLGKGQGTG